MKIEKSIRKKKISDLESDVWVLRSVTEELIRIMLASEQAIADFREDKEDKEFVDALLNTIANGKKYFGIEGEKKNTSKED